MKTAYLTHLSSLKHDMGAGHPECAARIHAIEDQLIASGLLPFLDLQEAPAASLEQLQRVHSSDYIESIFKASPRNGLVYLDADTAMNPYTLEAALHAAGAAVKGIDLVMSGEAANAFCNVRPPVTTPGAALQPAFASSTMWLWRQRMRSNITAWNAWRLPILTYITAMALTKYFMTMAVCCCAPLFATPIIPMPGQTAATITSSTCR
jgi:hypothetical protein